MSKKTDMLIVGTLSAALFTGFTAYSHFTGKEKNAAATSQPATGKAVMAPSAPLVQNMADSQVAPAADPAPPVTTRNKNTKTKAS